MGNDVAARLRDGWAALDNLQKCVDACGLAGYRLIDVYGSEHGLDLIALDADAGVLRAAAVRADEAAELVRAQPGRLSEAWRGPAGEQAADLVGGHAAAAARLASAVRLAAEACATLGAELWRIVGARVARTQTVATAVRPEWLTGEVAGEELKAFAHNIILGEWTAAMRQADDDARAVYRRAITTLDAVGPIGFAVPGPLATGAPPASAPSPTMPASAPLSTMPASAPSPAMPASAPSPAMPASVSSPVPAPQVPAPPPIPLDTYSSGLLQPPVAPPSAPASLPSMPMPDLGDGAPTMPQFAPDTPENPESGSHEDSEKPEVEPEAEEPEKPEPEKPEPEPEPESATPQPEPTAPQPEPTAPQPEPAAEPPATPCEIAADQLPQVGS
ncbi:MAG: hypothetical protein U0R18_13670 [Mycobacterium sp.]